MKHDRTTRASEPLPAFLSNQQKIDQLLNSHAVLLTALRCITHPNADDSDLEHALKVIKEAEDLARQS